MNFVEIALFKFLVTFVDHLCRTLSEQEIVLASFQEDQWLGLAIGSIT